MNQVKRRTQVLRVLCSALLLLTVTVTLMFIQIRQHSRANAAITMPHVQGNQIIDGNGNPLILRGAHIQSLLDKYKQYATTADRLAFNHLNSATFDVMVNNWHMNTVRIATSDYMWQNWATGSAAYIQILQNVVAEANQAGLYVVISMHQDLASGMPQKEKEPTGWAMPTPLAVTYWQTVAATFKNNPMVMFDLYNEPHVNKTAALIDEPSWNFWMNGGQITYITPGGQTKYYTVVGMQTLINTIRAQGAPQIIIAQAAENSFLNFETDCTNQGLPKHCNFLQDPANTANPNIVYSVHEYFVPSSKTPRQPAFWDGKFGLLSQEVPIFIGEWEFSIATPYLTRCEDVTGTRSLTAGEATQLVDSFLAYMQQHAVSWTTFAFTWGQMLTDNKYINYTPTVLYTTPPFVCGSITPLAGDGSIIKQFLTTGTLPPPTPPVLTAAPTSLTFNVTTGVSSQSITIGNSGGDALNWSAALDPGAPSFVTISSASSGTNLLAGSTVPLTISVDATGQSGGSTFNTNVTLTATDTVTGNPATASPITVPITINVAPPAMQLSSTSLSFTTTAGTNPPNQTITITNTGGDGLTWSTDTPSQPWLMVSPTSGTDASGATSTPTFSVNVTGLTSGTYTATVDVTPTGGTPQTVTVTLTVN